MRLASYPYARSSARSLIVRVNREFTEALEAFEKDMSGDGPFFFGKDLGWVDILVAPCK